MSEKLVIITEKPSAAKAFAKALGGMTGTFNGDEYSIVSLFGHILENPVPDETALPAYKDTVGKFANLGGIPWSASWFDFNKKVLKDDGGARVLRDINGYLKNGYVPVIASDIDESGEGDLLVWEVLIHLNYNGRVYREYHLDETVKGVQKSITNKKEIDRTDPLFVMAFTRSNMDYLTQQLTRVATMTIQGKGYKLPSPVPIGRLKSVMLVIIGDQIKAIRAYKPSSMFESRYKLDALMLTNKDVPQFKTKEEWSADGLPFDSNVREVRQVPGRTIPPKALTLSQLAGAMAKKGMKSKAFLNMYQKMYEAGYMSYPRTEDDFVSPEQFNEMLPLVDTFLGLLSLPTAAFTHRSPRPTHVKTGGAHGALRPGLTVPTSLADLDSMFGNHASEIYKLAGERFLMMFLEDTEWVRHEYETTDTPKPFVGSIKIITKQGVIDPDEDTKDVATQLPNLQKKAELYPHEVKSKKPHAVTSDWLFAQLGKVGVGTGSTRVGTLSNMSGNSETFPIKESKTLDLSTMGWVGYEVAGGTKIGSVDGTKYLTNLVKEVQKGKDVGVAYQEFTNVIAEDVEVLKNMSIDLDDIGIPKSSPKVVATGNWNGNDVTFNKVYMSHEFTDSEVATLLSGGEVTIDVTSNDGRQSKVSGKLANQEYKGHPFVGFKGVFVREGHVSGNWQGKDVSIKGAFMDHVFTPAELSSLFNGESVAVTTHKGDQTYNITGKLEVQTYNGNKYVGYKAVFPTRDGYVSGLWNGKSISFKGSYMDHTFTDAETKQLLAGETIHIVTHKGDKEYQLNGKLEVQEYQGRKFVGFKGQFDSGDREGYANGVWKGKQVSFKREFMKHVFTDSEVASLLNGDKIRFSGKSTAGKEMDVSGSLASQTYQGRKFVGFKADFGKK